VHEGDEITAITQLDEADEDNGDNGTADQEKTETADS